MTVTTKNDAAGSTRTHLSKMGARIALLARDVIASLQTARRAARIEHLFRLSDAELAERGLTRERLFDSVFGR